MQKIENFTTENALHSKYRFNRINSYREIEKTRLSRLRRFSVH